MQNYVQPGEIIEVTTPAGGYTSGKLVKVGELVGVSEGVYAEGETAIVRLSGVFEVPKATGAITQGAKLYFDESEGKVTTTTTDNTFCGYAFVAAANGDTIVRLKLAV